MKHTEYDLYMPPLLTRTGEIIFALISHIICTFASQDLNLFSKNEGMKNENKYCQHVSLVQGVHLQVY